MKPYVITTASGQRIEADAVVWKGLERWAIIKTGAMVVEEFKIDPDSRVANRAFE